MAKPIQSLPLDEEYYVDPMDSYGTFPKVVMRRQQAQFFQRTLRSWYLCPSGSEMWILSHTNTLSCFPALISKNPEVRRRTHSAILSTGSGTIWVDLCFGRNDLVFRFFNAETISQWSRLPKQRMAGNVFPRCCQLPRIRGTWQPYFPNLKSRKWLGFKRRT